MASPQKIILKGDKKPVITIYRDGVQVKLTPQVTPDIVLNKKPPAAPQKINPRGIYG